MRTSTQLKALIRNFSKETNVEAEILLRNFMMERFLERISLSEYKDKLLVSTVVVFAGIAGTVKVNEFVLVPLPPEPEPPPLLEEPELLSSLSDSKIPLSVAAITATAAPTIPRMPRVSF